MKITAITPQIFASNKTQNKQSFVYAKAEKTYGGDVFVKSVTAKNVSFGANLTMAEKFIPFKNEFLKYYKENSILTFDEIEKIIQKYLPDIKVCDLSTMQNAGNVHNRTGAYFENEILFTSDMKCKKGIQQICLIPQKTDKLEEKMQLAQGVIHEMTHALQENSKDRLSKDDFLNSLKGAEKNPYEFIEMLKFIPKYTTTVEKNVNFPLIKFMRKLNEIPNPLPAAGKKELDRIYTEMVGAPLEKYIYFLVSHFGREMGLYNFGIENQKNILKYLAHVSAKEKEAYKNQVEFAKEVMNIKTPVDLDLTKNLYAVYADSCKYLADRL